MSYTIEELQAFLSELDMFVLAGETEERKQGRAKNTEAVYKLTAQLLEALQANARLQARIDAAMAIPERVTFDLACDRCLHDQRDEFRKALTGAGEG